MTTSLVVTVIGADRPGLVDTLSSAALAHGANWEASRMVHLGGRFAGVFLVSVDTSKADALEDDLNKLEGLRVLVERSADTAHTKDCRPYELELIGHDRPGIIREVAHALAERGVNVEELMTECTSAPMTGDPLFTMTAQLLCPPSLSSEEIQELLEAIAHDLMVDITLALPEDE